MSDVFVPFSKLRSKTGPVGESFRLTILPQLQKTAPFLPVQAAPVGAAASNVPKEPLVTLERDGDRITRIKIQCTCGQVVELNCTY